MEGVKYVCLPNLDGWRYSNLSLPVTDRETLAVTGSEKQKMFPLPWERTPMVERSIIFFIRSDSVV